MNRDKIIKDLRKQNDSLKLQYEYRNIRCIHLEKENQQLKKQKNDVVSEIKRVLDIWENKPNEIATLDLEEILRMLGEIDELD